MEIKKELEKIIIEALKGIDIKTEAVHLEHPVDLAMGDYSTNVAMVEFGKMANATNSHVGEIVWVGKAHNPQELAKKIVENIKLSDELPDVGRLEKVEVAGSGFINFYLNKNFFKKSVGEILEQKENFGKNEKLKGQKIMIEYTDPNPFKEFHIGHLMSNSVGESISRVIEAQGAKIVRANYQGDVGMHVAKAIWGLLEKDIDSKSIDISILAEAYSNGAKNGNENEIKEINKKIYDRSDKKINDLYDKGRKVSLDYFETIYEKLGTNFDEYFFESETSSIGEKVVKENIGKVFEESDGAIVFKGENYDPSLHTRVFINSEGLPTYEAKELGLVKTKFEKYPDLDLSISVTGNEVKEYFKVLLKAMELITSKWSEKTKHISHGMLRLPEGKMSSRTGDVITAESLITRVEEIISKKTKDKDVIEKVSIGAIKYSILKSASGKDIIFDFDKSLAVEGNSGPYLQYTYARAKSVIDKAKSETIPTWKSDVQLNDEISDIEKLLYRFSEVVERAGDEYEPHYISTYLFELAQAFNSFYGNNKIADSTDENAPYKVALTEAVAYTIKNGLNLLGIETLEKM